MWPAMWTSGCDVFAVAQAEPDHVLLVEDHQGAAARAACMAAASPIAVIVYGGL